MIKIVIEHQHQEIEIIFNKVIQEAETVWIGKFLLSNEDIILREEDGFIDEKNMLVPTSVTTSKEVLYERFINAFNNYTEEINAGFEATDESISNQVIIDNPYNPDDIKVRRETFSVYEINRMMSKEDIDLNPDFQRNLVWDSVRKSALIESILLGIPIPVFYFAENKTGQYHVIDGLQRLSTIKQYFNNVFALKKLEHLKEECNERFYRDEMENGKIKRKGLDRKHSRRLENAQLIVNVIEYASPDKVKYDIFKRLNTGGRPLNKQEVRHCMANNKVRNLLKYCAHSQEFLQATSNSISDNRMDAQELVLRFLGFRLEKEGVISYMGDMNTFLDNTLDVINEYTENKLDKYKDEFINGLRINYHLFGKFCFRKCLSEHLLPGARKPFINKALFTSWMMETYCLNYYAIYQSIDFEKFSEIIAQELDKKEKYYIILTTGTSDKQNLKDASIFAKQLLQFNIL